MENNKLEKMKEETIRKDINKMRDEIIALEDAVSQCRTYAGYIRTLTHQLSTEYFIAKQPGEMDIKKIAWEYKNIQNFLEIADDYANKIKEVEIDYGLLQYMS